ncbi:MAG: hypothetical protein H7317_08585 [Pseudorhodobacter sp.]|nr:hypothetical protein [Pseudorhodobacter sp.]
MSDPFSTPREPVRDIPVSALRKAAAESARSIHVAVPGAAPQPAPAPAPEPMEIPSEFGFETEHPVMPIPFKVTFGDTRLDGIEISVTAAYVAINGALDPAWKGHKEFIKIQFDFQGFSVLIFPEVMVAGSRCDGEMTLQFLDPAGAHLPQLRYILNSYIAGDFVSMGGLMAYSGPTQPKIAKGAEGTASKFRIRSIAVAVMSLTLIVAAANVMLTRYTQSYEQRPVFVERLGNEMKATAAGQVAFLNPTAKKGEVVFSINSNTGDVLSFQLPCDCEVAVTNGIFVGATVLPIDSILSFFSSTAAPNVETQMSIEGLAKAMSGDAAYLDMDDGRTIQVTVVPTSATNAAALRGDIFVPVDLVPAKGLLGPDDIGKSARLRLSKSWFGASFPKLLEKS